MKDLLDGPLKVVNIGLEHFAADLRAAGVEVVEVDWSPPPAGTAALALAARLESGTPAGDRIDAANRVAVERLLNGDPVLVDVCRAEEVVPGNAGPSPAPCRAAGRVGSHVRSDAGRGRGGVGA